MKKQKRIPIFALSFILLAGSRMCDIPEAVW